MKGYSEKDPSEPLDRKDWVDLLLMSRNESRRYEDRLFARCLLQMNDHIKNMNQDED